MFRCALASGAILSVGLLIACQDGGRQRQLEPTVAALESKVDELETEIQDLQSKIDGLEGEVAELDSRIDGVETMVLVQ